MWGCIATDRGVLWFTQYSCLFLNRSEGTPGWERVLGLAGHFPSISWSWKVKFKIIIKAFCPYLLTFLKAEMGNWSILPSWAMNNCFFKKFILRKAAEQSSFYKIIETPLYHKVADSRTFWLPRKTPKGDMQQWKNCGCNVVSVHFDSDFIVLNLYKYKCNVGRFLKMGI